jgi:hypothetical protein
VFEFKRCKDLPWKSAIGVDDRFDQVIGIELIATGIHP